MLSLSPSPLVYSLDSGPPPGGVGRGEEGMVVPIMDEYDMMAIFDDDEEEEEASVDV